MNLREALQQQAPSLALQRAAADEIARLDARLTMFKAHAHLLREASSTLQSLPALTAETVREPLVDELDGFASMLCEPWKL